MNKLLSCSIAEFGSCVRKDDDAHSDRDVLIVFPRGPFPTQLVSELATRGYSCAVYSRSRFARLSESGALFVRHLVSESRIICDPEGFYASTLADFRLRTSYHSVFADSLAVFGLLERIPRYTTGVSWAADIAAVSFRSMAIPYLADRGIFAFGMDDICDALVSLSRITTTECQKLRVLRKLKGQYRSGQRVSCTEAELTELVDIIDRCFGVGIQRRFVEPADVATELYRNPPNDWYRGIRLVEALLLPRLSHCEPRLQAIRNMIKSPQVYGWKLKYRRGEVFRDVRRLMAEHACEAA